MRITDQAALFLTGLESKRNPVKPATRAAYDSYIRNWIIPQAGQISLKKFENGAMKAFVDHLVAAKLSASSISGITGCLKLIVSSAIDMNGNELYPRKWNNSFIDAPIIDPKSQKAPIIAREGIQEALQCSQEQFKPLYAMLAGTGLRISEALALHGIPVAEGSYYDRANAKLVIRQAMYHGRPQATKTAAGVREVDLSTKLNSYLAERIPETDSYIWPIVSNSTKLRDAAKKAGVPGFHSFRRFRVTHLESRGVPRGIMQFWTGHAGKDVTDLYVKADQIKQERREWCDRAGLGFEL